MSSLGYYEDDKWIHQCGATLVSSHHFLTAAHCVKNTTNWKIHVGDFSFSLPNSQLHGIDVNINNINIHPLYNNNAYFDIAIITTDYIKFTNNIQPICLPEYKSTDVHKYDRDHVDLLGWGASSVSGKTSKVLKRISQIVFPNLYCNNTHIREDQEKINIQKAVPYLFPSHVICAGTDHKSQGACKGDSGGPLQFYDLEKFRYQQVGVVHGSVSNCGQSAFPGIYARLDEPKIFNFLKLAIQDLRFVSGESDLHLFEFALFEVRIGIFNWRTNQVCFIKRINGVGGANVIVLNGSLMFCRNEVNERFDSIPTYCQKYLKESRTWENTTSHPKHAYGGGVLIADKGWVLFRTDGRKDYTEILDKPDGEWKEGPEVSYSDYPGEVDSRCLLQLNSTTTFSLRTRRDGYWINTFDWSTNKITEHKLHLKSSEYNSETCALMKDANGMSLVAMILWNGGHQPKMKIWNPTKKSLVSEIFPIDDYDHSGSYLVAINEGKEALLYPGSYLLTDQEDKQRIWKYNIALRTWSDTGLFFDAQTSPTVLPLDGFAIDDFNCIQN
jgi:hypothetical protein